MISFDPQTGVGEIAVDDGATATARRSHIEGGGCQSLREGERVHFELRHHPGGAEAIDVYTL
ncbi:cold shock domain-containing protein [Pseudonocardia ammonioxydans]|uniref:cold shock domain-containing protein n=1 Tax=Pseudonocardia ammonioxydans TaxID=260086 RepID=UPI0015A5674A|nr:cold shock domain-containing protein [Pseudonocardia ammonioxydans]